MDGRPRANDIIAIACDRADGRANGSHSEPEQHPGLGGDASPDYVYQGAVILIGKLARAVNRAPISISQPYLRAACLNQSRHPYLRLWQALRQMQDHTRMFSE